jgi:protein-S-isoprenylcysteine O-methyltransferase Ste14
MAVGDTNRPGPDPGAGRRSFGELVSSVVAGVRTLARQHVELAKLEAGSAVAVRAQGAGMFGGAAVLAAYAFGFLAAAGAAALAIVLPVWAAILIVGVLLLVIAWVLVMIGKRTMKSAPPAGARTQETLKEDAKWAKQQIAS